jgi:hypothetical protein
MRRRIAATLLVLLAAPFVWSPRLLLHAQVTTATFFGLVHDSSGAVVPGATVIATHQGTGVSREGITDERGEFVFSALPNGSYSVRIELPGFKRYSNEGIALGAGQTVRQTFVLELGAVEETVTVAGVAPLIETATSSASETLGSQEVRELPVNRRNVANLLSLAPGVSVGGSGGGMVSMNGVAGGGTAISVDGTEANSNPEIISSAGGPAPLLPIVLLVPICSAAVISVAYSYFVYRKLHR